MNRRLILGSLPYWSVILACACLAIPLGLIVTAWAVFLLVIFWPVILTGLLVVVLGMWILWRLARAHRPTTDR